MKVHRRRVKEAAPMPARLCCSIDDRKQVLHRRQLAARLYVTAIAAERANELSGRDNSFANSAAIAVHPERMTMLCAGRGDKESDFGVPVL